MANISLNPAGKDNLKRLRFALGAALLVGLTACQTPQFVDVRELDPANPAQARKPGSIVLHEGDVVKISFPGAPNLNTTQPIRRDGRITLQLIGEFQAAGMTPTDLEKELLKSYGPQLQTKEVSVTVESSAFPVYLTGAVLRPGKILSD